VTNKVEIKEVAETSRRVLGIKADTMGSLGEIPQPKSFEWTNVINKDLARWKAAREAAQSGPRVLFANAYGTDPTVANVESMLAVSLTMRGTQAHFLQCDGALPACWVSQIDQIEAEEFVKFGPSQSLCRNCFHVTSGVFQSLGLPVHRYSELISDNDAKEAAELSARLSLSEIQGYRLDGLKVGEHALSGALRFYARGTLSGEPLGEDVLRRYFKAALLTVFATRRLLSTFKFTCVSTLHGIYVPEGLIGEVAREQNVRVAAWSFSYRKRTFIFSHHDTYHHKLLSEPTTAWEDLSWTPEMEAEIVDYLNSRRYGTRDWVTFIEHPQEDIAAIAAELGVDFSKPCVGLLTNVVWDAQVHFYGNAFPNAIDWVLQTIRYFAGRPDLQLIVRIHPGELLGFTRARQTMLDEITRYFSVLPKNVFVIPPESAISTYTVASQCNAVLIYGTKAGIEVAAMGIPVVVAGEAWVRNKGVTIDAKSPPEYFKILDRLPLKEPSSQNITQRARKYAYHLFFRRMIPMPFTSPEPGSIAEPDVKTLDDLMPGRDAGLDVICNGILSGSEFIYPAELYPASGEDKTEVTEDTRARGSLRVLNMLGKLGDSERMRVHLLKILREFPSIAGEPWAQSIIGQNLIRVALASDKPIATVQTLWDDVRAATRGIGLKVQLKMRRLPGDVLRELAIALWKAGSYKQAGEAAAQALLYNPTQLIREDLIRRLARAVVTSKTDNCKIRRAG
jgi:Capsule polysaccharide biosynthesis protein